MVFHACPLGRFLGRVAQIVTLGESLGRLAARADYKSAPISSAVLAT